MSGREGRFPGIFFVSVMEPDSTSPFSPAGGVARVSALLSDSHEKSLTERLAGSIFISTLRLVDMG